MSGIARALAGLGAVAAGYVKGDGIRREREQGEEDRAFKNEQRARMRGDWQRQDKLRDDTAAAAAPTTVDDAPVVPPIGSRDEPRAPEDQGIRAAGRTFTSRADADKAATEYNAEPAVAKRVANVARMAGDYAGSQQVMNLSRQGRMADLQMQAAEESAARDAKLREMGGALIQGGWAAVPSVYERYNDGHRAEVIEDGKGGATVVKRSADGAEVGRKLFASLPEFFAGVAGQFDPKLWLDRQDKQAETTRAQGNLDREFTRRTGESDRDFQLRKDELARKTKHDERMLANDTARVGIARMAASRPAPGQQPAAPATPDSTFDAKTASDIAKDQVQKEADEARSGGKAWTAQQIALRTDSIVQAMRQQHTTRFIESAATRALAGAQGDPTAYAQAFEKVQQLGIPMRRLGEMGFKPPQRAAAPMQPAAPGAAVPAAATPTPAGAAAPTAPAGQAAAAVPFQQFVAQNITTPAGKQAISQRVMQELPAIQYRINGITQVMSLPTVSGAIKAKLKAELDVLAQDAQMMQAFAAGNPGI